MPQEFQAEITDYQYVGDIPNLGSLQLTMLARSFETVEIGGLGDMFPDENIDERTIVIEQIIEGLGIMPIVRFGVPGGGFVEPDRIRSMRVTPAVVREEDFIEQALINQLRAPGTMNQASPQSQIISRRVQKLISRHTRTKDLFRARTLLGGINYTDPRTGVSIDVSTNIPAHNFFHYKGWDSSVSANANVTVAGGTYKAAYNLVNDAGRKEAALFTSSDEFFGVPWTNPRANIIRSIQLIAQYLLITNKNRFTEIVMSPQLVTTIQAVNEYLKAYQGLPGVMVLNQPEAGTVAGNASVGVSNAMIPNSMATFGPGGRLTSIAGLRIRELNGMYRDPVTNTIKMYWPNNKVALVAPTGDGGARLGMTQHCVGESPDGAAGIYMRTSPDAQPPSPPGRVMQMGDAFLPFAIYPHWIANLTVCEETDISEGLILESNIAYGTF
jgi:hypothetical protein